MTIKKGIHYETKNISKDDVSEPKINDKIDYAKFFREFYDIDRDDYEMDDELMTVITDALNNAKKEFYNTYTIIYYPSV